MKKETAKETAKIAIKETAKETKKDTKTEKTELTKQETALISTTIKSMRTALKNFIVIGQGHEKVKDLVQIKYKSIKSFVEGELGISEVHYYRYVSAYEIHRIIQESGHTCLPHAESIVRDLSLKVLELMLKSSLPELVKGITVEKMVVDIWSMAYDKKALGIDYGDKARKATKEPTKKELDRIKLTANEIFQARNAWKALHNGKVLHSAEPSTDQTPKGNKVSDKSPDTREPELPVQPKRAAVQDSSKGNTLGSTPNAPDVSDKDLASKFAENRTELAKTRAKVAQLETALKAGKTVHDWQTCDLFKEIWEAGKAVVQAKCLEASDSDKVAAIQTLEKEVFGK